MEPSIFKERIGKVKEEKARRLATKHIRPEKLRFICRKIELADKAGRDSTKIFKLGLTDDEKEFLSSCNIKLDLILGLPNPLPKAFGSGWENKVQRVPKGYKLSW